MRLQSLKNYNGSNQSTDDKQAIMYETNEDEPHTEQVANEMFGQRNVAFDSNTTLNKAEDNESHEDSHRKHTQKKTCVSSANEARHIVTNGNNYPTIMRETTSNGSHRCPKLAVIDECPRKTVQEEHVDEDDDKEKHEEVTRTLNKTTTYIKIQLPDVSLICSYKHRPTSERLQVAVRQTRRNQYEVTIQDRLSKLTVTFTTDLTRKQRKQNN